MRGAGRSGLVTAYEGRRLTAGLAGWLYGGDQGDLRQEHELAGASQPGPRHRLREGRTVGGPTHPHSDAETKLSNGLNDAWSCCCCWCLWCLRWRSRRWRGS